MARGRRRPTALCDDETSDRTGPTRLNGAPSPRAVRRLARSWIGGYKLLFAILFIAFSIRVLPILWGIPLDSHTLSHHPDESKSYRTTADFPRVYFTDDRFITYGTAVSYSLGLMLIRVKLLVVNGLGLPEHYLTIAWLASRLLSVLCGTATVLVGYFLALRLFDRRTALLAAAFIALSFYHALNSALATLDVTMSFLLLSSFLLCFRAFDRPTDRAFTALGVVSGLLMGTKITGALFLGVPVLLSVLTPPATANPRRPAREAWRPAHEDAGGRRSDPAAARLRHLAILFASALAVFALFHPHVLLDFGRYVAAYRDSELMWVERARVTVPEMLARWGESTTSALGLPVVVLAAGGALAVGRRLWPQKLALLVFLALYYVLWRWYIPARFLIPVAPILCILAAHACTSLAGSGRRFLRVAGRAAAVGALLYSTYLCAWGVYLRLHDTRPPAARYVARSFERGTSVAMSTLSERYGWRRHEWRYPRVDLTRFREVMLWEQPEVVIVSSYDLEPMEEALRSDKLLPGYRWDPAHDRDWYRYSAPTPRLFRFYDELLHAADGEYELVRTFRRNLPVPIEFPPPEVRIYRRKTVEVSPRPQT